MLLKFFLKNKYVWLAAIIAAFLLRFSSGYFSDSVKMYTDSKIKNFANEIINESIRRELLATTDFSDILIESYDANGKVSYAYLNSNKVNKIKFKATEYVQSAIDQINNSESFETIEIPLGYFLGSEYMLADGMKMPIELKILGDEDIEIISDVSNRGINTTIIQLYLHIKINIQVVIPFRSQMVLSESKIPICFEILNNEVPYYLGDILN
jgi:sporulation protein YunB